MSARFRARAPGPVSGQLCHAPGRRTGHDGAGFLLPFGRRHSLLGHPVPPGDSAPLTIGLPHRQLPAARTRAGFPCSARVRHGRDRVPSVPRGRRCLHGHACIPWPPPAALQRPVPVTPVPQPIPGCFPHEASARVHWHSPLPAIPLTCNPRTEREPLGFTLGFTPGRAGPSRACQGGDEPQALARDHAIAISDLPQRTHSTRAASRRKPGSPGQFPVRGPLRTVRAS